MLDIKKIEETLQSLKSKNEELLAEATAGNFIAKEEYIAHMDKVRELHFWLNSMAVDGDIYPIHLGEYKGVISLLEGKVEKLLEATYLIYDEIVSFLQVQHKQVV